MASEGSREIEAARQRLATAEAHASSASNMMDSEKLMAASARSITEKADIMMAAAIAAQESAKSMTDMAEHNMEAAQYLFESTQKEIEEAKAFLKEAEKRRKVIDFGVAIDVLSIDEVAIILGYLSWREILRYRVCKKWKNAALVTTVPLTHFILQGHLKIREYSINSAWKYEALTWMARSLPLLQQINICNGMEDLFFEDGEDPEPTTQGLERQTHQINDVAMFSNLRSLSIKHVESLNGRYPCLFNFKHL